ncbi:MAG: rod shape-determining protein MreC [Clostridia bacterium]|nr:rod shape-determining protein MreC [Clostridia bacterium]
MRWISRHKKLMIVTIVTILLIIVMSVSYLNDYSTTDPEKKIGNIITLFQEPFVKAGNGLNKGITGIFRFKAVITENEKLKEEVSILKNEIINLQLKRNELEELKQLEAALNYANVNQDVTFITGNVIAKDGTNWFNTFTINIGEDDGLTQNCIALNGDGLIGRVFEVGNNWSKIVAIVDDSHSVSFRITRDTKYIGVVDGDGQGSLHGYLMDPNADVLTGDEIITSGLGIFPEGIPIGTVEEVIKDENKLLKTVKVKPYVYFKNIDKVLVIKY